MLSTAAYMLDIALTRESSLVCISSSNDSRRRIQPPQLPCEPRAHIRHAFNIHCAERVLMCGVAVGWQ